ncbi:MAG: [FeFe] hydrogenase, group A [Oscillospiraceae bacterium]|nr:[FeFe] hydrogenase, group A [Oscillospiraceae bacterium]MDE6656994.1 [FeFe] hydrogenase, group A [Oscillospiraceae bacterium]
MADINIKINGIPVTVPKGTTVLEAAHMAGVDIPTFCYMKEINEIGACRICMAEINEGRGPRLVASCVYPLAFDGTEIMTNSPKVMDSRRKTLELILSTHEKKCLSCVRSGNCELQTLCNEMGIEHEEVYEGEKHVYEIDNSAVHMYRDNNKCILCRRCVAVCSKWQGIGVIGANERGFKTNIGSAFEMGLGETSCVSCGQCIAVCPVGALSEKDFTNEVFNAIADSSKHVIVQTAPAVRAALGEEFGYPIGTNVEGKMVAALRRLGFDDVFDTDWGADLTIMEEATEFVDRFKNGGKLPMMTSCSPGWVKYCEHYFPDLLDNLSSCKSPHQMVGAMAKTYYAEKIGKKPEDIIVVSVMPCTAKKYESQRDDENAAGVPDVDYVLTTRELARMIRRAGLKFTALPDEDFDNPLGLSSGAGDIFGATGGVMEAALRTAYCWLTGKNDEVVEFTQVRGTDGIKRATIDINGTEIKVAVASGLANARELLKKVQSGEEKLDFIEIMGCPGGCVNGGGQPQQPASVRNFEDLRELRAKALYDEDANKQLRLSHLNTDIQKLYEEYLHRPGGHKSHKTLHTSYVKRSVN